MEISRHAGKELPRSLLPEADTRPNREIQTDTEIMSFIITRVINGKQKGGHGGRGPAKIKISFAVL
jgi:hypothetical protein